MMKYIIETVLASGQTDIKTAVRWQNIYIYHIKEN